MYRCGLCGKTAPPHTQAYKVTVETRRATYPLRPKVFACWKWEKGRRKFVRPDDPGGIGRQVAREVTACPDCARRVGEETAADGLDVGIPRGNLPRTSPRVGFGRAPPYRPKLTPAYEMNSPE
jgi:hypothetical protein